jgi:hypothetical protein
MNFQNIDLSKISYEIVENPPHVKMTYQKKDLEINCPVMSIPFGVDSIYNKYYIKLQFDDFKQDIEMEGFFNLLMLIEQHIEDFLESNIDENIDMVSEFGFKDKFDPTLSTKLISYNGKIKTKIINKNGSELNHWDLKKRSKVKCKISLNGIWKVKEKFYYKWNLVEIKLLD